MMSQRPLFINPGDSSLDFPDVNLALREPDGLLAVGGDLTVDRILSAYKRGIFPWYSENQPILWWSPDPRTVLFPARLKISRSLRKTLRRGRFRVTMDQAFSEVINACATPRPGSSGTWITQDMVDAYSGLHAAGCAHSVECWLDDRLVGGLYGVSTGRVFFGESMFSRVSDASKVAFAWLVRQLKAWDIGLLDCQIYSAHLASLGAEEIPRADFIKYLDVLCENQHCIQQWDFQASVLNEPW
jgi:leucyl/phenylalanyl-tRNA--protein transferase